MFSNSATRPQCNSVEERAALPNSNNRNNSSGMSLPGLLTASRVLKHYRRSQLFKNGKAAKRLRCPFIPGPFLPPTTPVVIHESAPFLYAPNFPRDSQTAVCPLPAVTKGQLSYVGLIATAILSSPEKKLLRRDICQFILDNYPYFRASDSRLRQLISVKLSINDCFIKAGKTTSQAHYWAIHPANLDDFNKGDFQRQKAHRKVRCYVMAPAGDREEDILHGPPPSSPPQTWHHSGLHQMDPVTHQRYTLVVNNRKRQLDEASLLAPKKQQQQQNLNNDNLSPSGLSLKINGLKQGDQFQDQDQDQDRDQDSSGESHDVELDDTNHGKVPAASLSSEDLNRSISPKSQNSAREDTENLTPSKENSNCGSSFSPLEFLSQCGHFVQQGTSPPQYHGGPQQQQQQHVQSPLNNHAFDIHHLLQNNPSLAASLILFLSQYLDLQSNMAKKSE